jgi:membrane-bound lytic murein transglycosylase A
MLERAKLQRMKVAGLLVFALSLTGCASVDSGGSEQASLNEIIQKGLGISAKPRSRTITSSTPTGLQVDRSTGVQYQAMNFGDLSGWANDDHQAALVSFKNSCAKIRGMRSNTPLGGIITNLQDWRAVCAQAALTRDVNAKGFFEQHFKPVRIAPHKKATLTAYYEPELPARRIPDAQFRFPIFNKPPELISQGGSYGHNVSGRFQPYFTRGEIDRGALHSRGLELAFLNDPVDLFFLQVQGSGRLRMGDNSLVRVGFAAKNGHAYRSVGKELVRRGWSRSGSRRAIQDFVRGNPPLGFELLAHNKSYIFFRETAAQNPNFGPPGAIDTQLMDKRSIAVDRRYTPLGAPVWVEGTTPVGGIAQLMIAQDTGSAIKGPQRADIFWGTGEAAGNIAGQMKDTRGRMTVLMPRFAVARAFGIRS